jgi:hypothetical protein
MRDYWPSLLSRSILPKGSTGALEARGDLHSRATETMKEAWEIWLSLCREHGWRGPRLSRLWGLRVGQEVASPVFGWLWGVSQPEHLLRLEDKHSFPPAVFGPPFKPVRSWKRVLVFKERKKEKASVHWSRVLPT